MNRRSILKSLVGLCCFGPFFKNKNKECKEQNKENPVLHGQTFIYDYLRITTNNTFLKVGDLLSYDDYGNIVIYDKNDKKNIPVGYCISTDNSSSDIVLYRL